LIVHNVGVWFRFAVGKTLDLGHYVLLQVACERGGFNRETLDGERCGHRADMAQKRLRVGSGAPCRQQRWPKSRICLSVIDQIGNCGFRATSNETVAEFIQYAPARLFEHRIQEFSSGPADRDAVFIPYLLSMAPSRPRTRLRTTRSTSLRTAAFSKTTAL